MQIQNIVFDLGGVLVDWDPESIAADFTADPALRLSIVQNIFRHPDWHEIDREVIPRAELLGRFAVRTGLPDSEISRLMSMVLPSLTLRPDTVNLMDELIADGRALYCLSNMPVDNYVYLRGRYDFFSRFSGVVISGAIKMVKPDRAIFDYLVKQYDLNPASCLFLDDREDNILGARAAGWHGLLYSDAAACRHALRDEWGIALGPGL